VIGICVGILASGSSNNKFISLVKNGHPTSYPNLTYGKAFENFFTSPTWKYFKSNTREDVVEFTGYCNYQEVKVKADLQFILNVDTGKITVGALSINDVPQVNLITYALISKIFESQ
jgi:CO dehydrogenase/acetyl-CoA synthase epsilon subunit